MNTKTEVLFIIASIACFVLGVVAELMKFNVLSCLLISTMLIFVFFLVAPYLFRRFKKKNTKVVNFLNLLALILFSFMVVYLLASLLYFVIWGHKFWDKLDIIFYPCVIVYLLIEAYLNFIIKEKYKYHDE